MKKTILLTFALNCFSLMAQQYYPNIVPYKRTGFMQLQDQNPYILSLVPEGAGWVPSMRYLKAKAPNIDLSGLEITSSWENGTWMDRNVSTDSFELDNQNRISIAYSKLVIDYPGYSYQGKNKYTFAYNANNQIERFEQYEALDFTSNTYRKTGVYYFFYDLDGKRTRDSSIYYYQGGSQIMVSHHIYLDNKLQSTAQLIGSDTTAKDYYTYSGDWLTSTTSVGFDPDLGEWVLNSADSFEYNLEGQIIRRSSIGYVFRDGELSIEPTQNNSYVYTPDNQLQEEINRIWDNGIWIDISKKVITYGANQKPVVGYEYIPEGSGWSTIPRTKYLFSIQTGTHEVLDLQHTISLYPNPATDKLTLNTGPTDVRVRILDLTGKQVFESTITNSESIDVSEWRNGLYAVEITDGSNYYKQKVLIAH